MDRQVYLSHSRQNSGVALRLYDELSKRGVKTWLDLYHLGSGENWEEKLEQAIKGATAFVFLIGPLGPHDRFQKFEWQQVAEEEYYLEPDKPMIPALIGQPEIPGFLNDRQIVRIEDSGESISAAADKIVAGLIDPASTFDQEKRHHGKEARKHFLESILQDSMDRIRGSR